MIRQAFRLATLLRLREHAREQCRRELAESRRKDEELVKQLARLDAEQLALQDAGRRMAGPGEVVVERLQETASCAATIRARRTQTQRRRDELADEIRARLHALVEADRGVRVLEKLRERQNDRCRLEEERQQAKQLDEAALRPQTTVL